MYVCKQTNKQTKNHHLHISTRISHILLSLSGYLVINWESLHQFGHNHQPSEYSNILKWVWSIIVKDLIDWFISMCFYWMLSISSISFKAIIKSASNHRACICLWWRFFSCLGGGKIFYWCCKLLRVRGCPAGCPGPVQINIREILRCYLDNFARPPTQVNSPPCFLHTYNNHYRANFHPS